MKNKSINKYSWVALGIIFIYSCTKKIDEAYLNPNAPVKPPVEQLMPTIVAAMCNHFTSSTTNFGPQQDGQYVGRYVQFWATNTSLNQYDQMGMTTTNSAASASDIGGAQWGMHYHAMGENLENIKRWATEEKKWDYVGVAYIIRAFGWLAVTDMHGEVIVHDAFDPGSLTFRYDPQADAYEAVKENVRLGIEYLNRTGDGVSASNLEKGTFYSSMKGDVEKWKKLGYALMARVFHRITNKAGLYQPDSVIYYANLAMTDNADNAYILFASTNSQNKSYYSPSRGNIGVLRQTKFSADLLSGNNSAFSGVADPRAWYILRENAVQTFRGLVPGLGFDTITANQQPYNYWGSTGTTGSDANARYVYRDGMPWPLATAAEMEFLKAEAYYRMGNKGAALTAYINGISKNFDMLTTVYNANVPDGTVPSGIPDKRITPAMKTAFLANPLVVPTAANLTLSHIMLQKFIALYGFGFMETWADMRRFHYTDTETVNGNPLQVYRDFVIPTLFGNNNGKVIYRVRPRFNSEYRWNLAAITAIGGAALDFHTKEQWFSQQ
jgi:hypothetical protein